MRKVAAVLILAATGVWLGVEPTLGASKAGKQVFKVTLKEMSIAGAPLRISSGSVTFQARNVGTVQHELVLFKGVEPLKLKNFKGLEAGRWLGEVAELDPGKSGKVTLTLKPGKYLLACNVAGHYQLGMHRMLVVS